MISTLIDFSVEHAALLTMISIISLIVGMALVPYFVTRIPVDYFSHPHRHRLSKNAHHPVIRLMILGIKNLLGAVLVLTGIVLLFLPGQGLITLLVGLMVMNYPGKFTLERWIIQRPKILPAVNWLRQKYNHPPLLEPWDGRTRDEDDI